jgi:hypothetical protein
MPTISDACKRLLLDANISADSQIEFNVNSQIYTMTFEYIIDTFMQASQESQEFFLQAMKHSLDADVTGIDKFFESMGELLLRTHLSDKIEV